LDRETGTQIGEPGAAGEEAPGRAERIASNRRIEDPTTGRRQTFAESAILGVRRSSARCGSLGDDERAAFASERLDRVGTNDVGAGRLRQGGLRGRARAEASVALAPATRSRAASRAASARLARRRSDSC
jgi:hypothetical protein